jgi:hypothetical protein
MFCGILKILVKISWGMIAETSQIPLVKGISRS